MNKVNKMLIAIIKYCFITDNCGPPPPVNYSTMNSNGTSEYAITEYQCKDGYWLTSATNTLVCMDTGMWTGVRPSCTGN